MKVITVTATGENRPSVRLAIWTWIAVAAVPVGWALGVLLAFASGGAREAAPVAVGLAGVAVFATVPAVAVLLAVRLRQRGHPSGRAAVVVSALLLAMTLLVTMLVGPIAMLTVAILMAPLGVYLWRSRTPAVTAPAEPAGDTSPQKSAGPDHLPRPRHPKPTC